MADLGGVDIFDLNAIDGQSGDIYLGSSRHAKQSKLFHPHDKCPMTSATDP